MLSIYEKLMSRTASFSLLGVTSDQHTNDSSCQPDAGVRAHSSCSLTCSMPITSPATLCFKGLLQIFKHSAALFQMHFTDFSDLLLINFKLNPCKSQDLSSTRICLLGSVESLKLYVCWKCLLPSPPPHCFQKHCLFFREDAFTHSMPSSD